MSTVCGRPQGGRGPAHVDACGQGGVKNVIFCGRHKWMAPYKYTGMHNAALANFNASTVQKNLSYSYGFNHCCFVTSQANIGPQNISHHFLKNVLFCTVLFVK